MKKILMMILAAAFGLGAWGVTVTTEADLRTAIASGGTVELGGNIALTEEIAVGTTVTLDLGTYTISSPTNVFRVAANGNFTVNADASNPGGISVPTNRCCVYTSYGWDPGAKTVVLNGGVFTGNCVFNWAASALSAYVSYENYGLAVDGAGSGEKAVPTSVTINGGTFTGGYELGNVGAYRCYYFTVNGGTFEKGLDCADTRYCSIGVTTTCKAYFNGGRYRDRYPTFRKKTQGLSVVDDPGKVFIGTASHTNSYYIAGGYYVNAYDRSACEVTGTYAGAAVQNSYLIFLTTGYPQRWYNPSATWYFLTEADADDVGATNVIHINEENGSLPQLQTAAASSSAIRLASGKGTLLAASKSAASTEVAPARLLSAVPVRLLSTASATADVITTRPDGTELGEIKVVGNDGHTYITQNASLLSGTVFKTELDADRIDACYFFGPASSPFITENDGSDDATAYAAIYKKVSPAAEALFGEDQDMEPAMTLSFTVKERQLLLDNAEALKYSALDVGEFVIKQSCFSDNGNGSYGVSNEMLDAMTLLLCVYTHPTLATSDAEPFESDPHLHWTLSLVVSFDKAVAADSVRMWWMQGGSNKSEEKDEGRSVPSLEANVEHVISLSAMSELPYYFNAFLTEPTSKKPNPLLVAVQNLSNANNGTAVKVALRVTDPNNSSKYADRASFTHVFGRDTIVAAKPVEGRFEEYNSAEGPNVHWGEWDIDAENDKGTKMGFVYSSTRTALETAFNAIENVSETGLENVIIAAAENETQQKWVQIEWHGLVSVRNGYPMTTIAFGITPNLRTIAVDENGETTSDTTRIITNAEIGGKTITFRLPLTDDFTAKARVVHTSEGYPTERWIADVGGEAGARYVEISTTHFSEFTVSPVSANVATTSVQSANLFGAVKITGNVASNMYVAVPFEGFESAGAARKAKDVVHPANLTAETKMYVYNKTSDSHDVYKVASGAWAPAVKVTINSNNAATLDAASLDRAVPAGTGVLVARANAGDNVYVYGQIPGAAVNPEPFAKGQTFVAPPYTNATVEVSGVKYIDLNASKWTDVAAAKQNRKLISGADFIQFRDASNRLIKFYYDGTSWGLQPTYAKLASYKPYVEGGKALVPQGTAFWYCSSVGGAKVEWK